MASNSQALAKIPHWRDAARSSDCYDGFIRRVLEVKGKHETTAHTTSLRRNRCLTCHRPARKQATTRPTEQPRRKETSEMADNDPIIIGQGNTETNETSLSRNEATDGTVFVARNLNVGDGIHGEATGGGIGVTGTSTDGTGVRGAGVHGVYGRGTIGVYGRNADDIFPAVQGVNRGDGGAGVYGESRSGDGVVGESLGQGQPFHSGVTGVNYSDWGNGVAGISSRIGVFGHGVAARSVGGLFHSDHGDGVDARSISRDGLHAESGTGNAVYAEIWGDPADGGVAGRFVGPVIVESTVVPWREGNLTVEGSVHVSRNLTVLGSIIGDKTFQIDHPLDPENRYLLHSCVESSERKNVYDGVALLDEDGEAWVDLPKWFEALNGDFRYQLTAVSQAAPNLHVAEEVTDNRFKIAGGEEGMKVCWQLTGSRKDRWAAANPFEVEQEKPEEDRGRYLHPDLYGEPEEQRVMLEPIAEARLEEQEERQRQIEERRQQIDEMRRRQEERRREMEELRWRRERQEEEGPPENM